MGAMSCGIWNHTDPGVNQCVITVFPVCLDLSISKMDTLILTLKGGCGNETFYEEYKGTDI